MVAHTSPTGDSGMGRPKGPRQRHADTRPSSEMPEGCTSLQIGTSNQHTFGIPTAIGQRVANRHSSHTGDAAHRDREGR